MPSTTEMPWQGERYEITVRGKAALAGWESTTRSRAPTDAEMIAGIRNGERWAIERLFTRYSPMLRTVARRLSPCDDQMVATVLGDFALRLMDGNAVVPRCVSSYLVTALRNRSLKAYRDEMRERERSERGASHSAWGLRDSNVAPNPSLLRLATAITHQLQTDDLALLSAHDGRTLREIAAEQGIAYGCARGRLHRLRNRLQEWAAEYVRSLVGSERREVERFLRRASGS